MCLSAPVDGGGTNYTVSFDRGSMTQIPTLPGQFKVKLGLGCGWRLGKVRRLG